MVRLMFIVPKHSYVTIVFVQNLYISIFSRVYPYVTRIYSYGTRILLVLLVCTRMCSCVTSMLLVRTRIYSCGVLVAIEFFLQKGKKLNLRKSR